MPLSTRASGLWDIQVQIQGEGKLQRVASLNHPVVVKTAPSKTSAIVNLKPSVDRSLVPNRDFVLYIRDEGLAQPTTVSAMTLGGQQAISISILPDDRNEFEKSRVMQDIRSRMPGKAIDDIDTSADVKYGRNEVEQMQHEEATAQLDEESDYDDEEMKDESENCQEYIFLIDRSGSMYNTIKLARQALVLFLYSLPAGSKFNICSYGSKFEFMFSERSVAYNDDTLQQAVAAVNSFEADFGGTEIYSPLANIFSKARPADCKTSHIYLLTDGAIWDVKKVVNLVSSKCNFNQRVHTFGVGHGASEELIK